MKSKLSHLLPLLLTVVVLAATLALPGCDNTPEEKVSYTISDTTGDWGYPSPYSHYSRGPGYVRMSFIFETLVWKDDSGFVPQLAESWEYIEADNAYRFNLQHDVTWHDGEPFTADDVVFTINYCMEHQYQWVDNSIVSSAEALDDHTVVLYLSQPYAHFFQNFAGALPILPQHIWEGVTEPETFLGDEAVIGTGLYTLEDYNKEQGTYLYLAYDDYYLGTPAVDELKFVKISEELIPAALEDGTVSMGSLPADITADFEAAGFTIITPPPSWNAKLTINHQKEPLSNKEFRQALAYAIDRQQLVEITQRGYAMAGNPGLLPPTSAWYNPDVPQYEYDVAKAQELLTGLGYTLEGDYFTKDGQVLTLELIAAADFQEVGQFIQQQLELAGIKIEFTTLESKTVDTRVDAWEFDLSIYGHGGLYDPSILKTVILDDGFNSARYTSNETLTQLITDQFNEMDEATRRDMILQAQQIYAEDLPALSLYYPESYTAHDGSVDLFYTIDGIAIGVPIALNRMAFVNQ